MICFICKNDLLVNDFINSGNICYKCVFRKKMENIRKSKTKKSSVCRSCGNLIVKRKDVKKRQRTIFCSESCAQIGHKEQTNNHWTRKVRLKDSLRS